MIEVDPEHEPYEATLADWLAFFLFAVAFVSIILFLKFGALPAQ